jgi:hypothetical protein
VLNFNKDYPHQFISGRYKYSAPQHYVETQLGLTGSRLSGFRQVNHRRESLSFGESEFYYADFLPLADWMSESPEIGTMIHVRFPDLSDATISNTTYELSSISAAGSKINYWHSEGQTPRQIEVDDDGHITAYRFGAVVELTQVEDPGMLQLVSDVDQYESQLVTLDKHLGDPKQVQRLELKVLDNELFKSLPQSSRQRLASDRLYLNSDIAVIPAIESNEQGITNLVPEHLQLRMAILAASVVEGQENDLEKLTAIRDYVSFFVEDSARVATPDLEALLNQPEGDCTEHTMLFNALAASLGYEVRPVNGLVYLGDEVGGFGGHQWSEVRVGDYWVSFDATWNINSLTGTHIRLDQETADNFYRQLQTGNEVKLELISAELKKP